MSSAGYEDEEVESLITETTNEGKQVSGDRAGLFRPSFLLMIALVSVLLFALLFTDSIEIRSSNKNEFGSSENAPDSSIAKNSSDQIGMPNETNLPDSGTSESGESVPKSAPVSAPETPVATELGQTPKAETENTPQSSAAAIHPLAGEPGFKPDPQLLSDTYLKRGKPVDEEEMAKLAETWGQWTLVDPKADQRPQEDFYVAYPSRDVPYDKFPDNAWQKDKDYLSKFIPEAKALVERAMEAILAEYGHSKFDEPDKDFETRAEMFSIAMYNFTGSKPDNKRGGWMPQRSIEGLVRRVLHAIMTEDTFTLVTAGHSAAAGKNKVVHGEYCVMVSNISLFLFQAMETIFSKATHSNSKECWSRCLPGLV